MSDSNKNSTYTTCIKEGKNKAGFKKKKAKLGLIYRNKDGSQHHITVTPVTLKCLACQIPQVSATWMILKVSHYSEQYHFFNT